MADALTRSGVDLDQILAVLDAVPTMLGYWDRDLRNRMANRGYREYFGVTAEQIAGMHASALLGDAVFAANAEYMERALTGETQIFDRSLPDATGTVRDTQVSYIPDAHADGIAGFFSVITDITARVEAETALDRSADQYRALARSMPGGFVLLFDTDLRFHIAEGAELGVFGFRPAELEGRTLGEALPADLAAELEPLYRAGLAGRQVSWERQLDRRTFALTAGPVRDEYGTIFAGMVAAHDVTDFRRTEALLRALREVATTVARHAPAHVIAEQIGIELTTIFGVDTAAIVRYGERDTGEVVAMVPSRPSYVPRTIDFTSDPGLAVAHVHRTGAPALVRYEPQPEAVVTGLQSAGFRAAAAAPILHRGTVWGCVSVAHHEPELLTPDFLDQLAEFAELITIALGNLEAWAELADQADTDSLTGLPNRRYFDHHLALELDRAVRTGRAFTVAIADVDLFKNINDSHGHPVGDQVLVEVAATLQRHVGPGQTLARLGGEEFAWLLPDTDGDDAFAVAEHARRALARRALPGVGTVTASIGVCCTTDVDDPADVLIGADSALYSAKAAGRNTTIRYRPPRFASAS